MKQDKGTGAATRAAYKNADLFCLDQFDRNFITVLADMSQEVQRTNQLDAPLMFMQKFTTWLGEPHLELRMNPSSVYPEGAPCTAKETGVIRGYNSQLRLILKKVGGIPISSEDVKDYKISYPAPANREQKRKMTNEEFRLICDKQVNFRRQMLYRIKKDAEARIGAMVQLRKKHFDTSKRPIEIFFPASIMKKKNGVSYENIKYVIKEDEEALLKLLDQTPTDDSLVFGVTENVKLAINDEEKVWSKLVTKLGLGERYKHNGFLKLSLHTIKSLTFTAARKAVDLDFANAYGDHADYIRNYLRLSDEEKVEYFKKLEPFISVYTKTIELHDDEELHKTNDILQNKITTMEERLQVICDETKNKTKLELTPAQISNVLEIIKKYNL